jgi:hypothetical protein
MKVIRKITNFISNISPLNIPFFKKEPSFSFNAKNMYIFIQTSNNKNLLIVLYRLGSKELFRFLQRAVLHSQNHIRFSVEIETITNPTIISTENQNFRII